MAQGNSIDPKTKIVVTLGPASDSPELLRELLRAGLNVARINTSHADPEAIVRQIRLLREAAAAENRVVGLLLDLAGPKIRVANIPPGGRTLVAGETLTLGPAAEADLQIRPAVGFKAVADEAQVMLDDGRFRLEVLGHISDTLLELKVIYGGLLTPNKGVNFPGVALDVPSVSEADKANLRLGLREGIDWVALSFVRSASDREPIEAIFAEEGRRVPVMAKIEKPEAVEDLAAIIDVFDGIIVARGDLGVEMALEQVPLIQKRIISACRAAGKPVITATQLLDSMVTAPTPTRAEVNDVANAIFDGTDALMLSNETAVGKYPVEAVKTLHNVALATESSVLAQRRDGGQRAKVTVGTAISHAACTIARECGFPVIVTMTHSGVTARGVSRFRPAARIVAFSPSDQTCRQLQLVWGVFPLLVEEFTSTDEMIANAEKRLLDQGLIGTGEYFVFTAGVPIGIAGSTNLLKVQQVGSE